MKVIVVGGTSGLGLAIVRELLRRGDTVVATGRNFDQTQDLGDERFFRLVDDVTQLESIPEHFVQATDLLGGLDLIIYSSGVMSDVSIEEFSSEKDIQMIQVNCAGAVAWLNLAAARFQGTAHGCIMGIGSMAGDRGRRGQPGYNASKAYLHSYLEALRNRLARHGVKVVTMKPGYVATPMTAHLDQAKMMSAEVAARKCLSKVGRNGEFYLTPVHFLVMKVIQLIPGFIFRRLNV